VIEQLENVMGIQEVFARAFQIWKRARKLWILGLLTVLTGTSGISANFNVNLPVSDAENTNIPQVQIDESMILGYLQWIQENIVLLGLFLVVFILLSMLIQVFFAAWVQGATIDLAAKADMGQELSIRSSFGAAAKRLPSLTGVMLALRIPSFISLIFVFVMIINIFSLLINVLNGTDIEQAIPAFLGIFFCSFFFVLLILLAQLFCSFLEPLALRVCLFEQQAIWASIRRAFALIRQNLGLSFLSWFAMGVVATVIGMILSIAGIFFVVIGTSISSPAISYLIFAVGGLIFFGLALGLGALFASYLATLWNVIYRVCITPKPQNPAPPEPQTYIPA
jgi:hypothetical protein